MGREKDITGRLGEMKALAFLKKRGYKILEANYRTPFGELDLIAKKDGFTVFIEIKTRMTSSLGPPYLSITRTKKRHLIRNALAYLKVRRLIYSNWRIDIVSVKLNYNYAVENKIEIIENAVEDYGGLT